jgi:hypothetical protein
MIILLYIYIYIYYLCYSLMSYYIDEHVVMFSKSATKQTSENNWDGLVSGASSPREQWSARVWIVFAACIAHTMILFWVCAERWAQHVKFPIDHTRVVSFPEPRVVGHGTTSDYATVAHLW